jgi:hypothetical protein
MHTTHDVKFKLQVHLNKKHKHHMNIHKRLLGETTFKIGHSNPSSLQNEPTLVCTLTISKRHARINC